MTLQAQEQTALDRELRQKTPIKSQSFSGDKESGPPRMSLITRIATLRPLPFKPDPFEKKN